MKEGPGEERTKRLVCVGHVWVPWDVACLLVGSGKKNSASGPHLLVQAKAVEQGLEGPADDLVGPPATAVRPDAVQRRTPRSRARHQGSQLVGEVHTQRLCRQDARTRCRQAMGTTLPLVSDHTVSVTQAQPNRYTS